MGRDAALVDLRERLLTRGTAVAQALHGIGGVGKTQLAVEYAHRFAGSYELVWWITAERTELIPTQLADLAVEAGIADATIEIPAAVTALHADLRHRPGWLLIFDNAEDPRALRQWLPRGPGHVLITSRNPNWSEIAAPIDVPVFAAEESVSLLRQRVPGMAQTDAEQVAARLGNLPLALAQAADLLGETGLPAITYLDHLAGHAADVLAQGTSASYGQSLAAAVGYAVSRLASADPAAATLLRLSASLGPEPIPTSLFTTGVAKLPEPLLDIAPDPFALHRSLGRISSYGLARLGQDGLQVHRLVQAILRDQLTPGERDDDARRVGALLIAAGPTDTDDPATWSTWAGLLPHLLAANPAESNSPELRRLAVGALLYLLRRGDSQTAEQLAAALFDRWTQRLGPDDVDTLAAATELAHARANLGRLSEIQQLIEDTLARQRRILGDDHPSTLGMVGIVAALLLSSGNRAGAQKLAERTLPVCRNTLGPGHPTTKLMAQVRDSSSTAAMGRQRASQPNDRGSRGRRR